MEITDIHNKNCNAVLAASDSPEVRAKRIKRVRNLANLSREQMCAGGEINHNTLIGWENGRFGGLTSAGAKKIIKRITKEAVYCSLDWLMHGTGPEPSVNPIPLTPSSEWLNVDESIVIAYELAFFKAKNPFAVDLIVADNSMQPQFCLGELVAGKARENDAIESTIGHDCIVKVITGEILLRNVRKGDQPNKYTLVCTNPHKNIQHSVMANVSLAYAAPIIWHRKKDIVG